MDEEGMAWHPGEDASDSAWAHVSGWMQLGCERRCVSCVVPICNHEREITPWLGVLTDALTDAGYPWELLLVDAGSHDLTRHILRRWSELPGVRLGLASTRISRAHALLHGMRKARGDAVVLVSAGVGGIPQAMPAMISRWNEGAQVVRACVPHGERVLRLDADPRPGDPDVLIDPRDFGQAQPDAVLMARSVYAPEI